MPSPRKGGRSASRGRPAGKAKAAAKTPKKAAAAAPAKMDFEEGDAVMARWPGTQLFFKSKVTYVRDEDNEYDVQFEDGTVYTLKAKEVKKSVEKAVAKKTPASRSRSRGRSPGRKASKSPARSPQVANTSRTSRRSTVVSAPKPDATPTRQSARIAARADAISDDDETHGKKAIPNPSHSKPKKGLMGWVKSLSFEWVGVLVMMGLFPLILVSLHTLCTSSACKPSMQVLDKLPKTLKGYWDQQAFLAVLIFSLTLGLLSKIPLGSKVKTATGNEVRMNGFLSLITILALMPVVVYKKIDISLVQSKFFYLMISAFILAFVKATIARLSARFMPGRKYNVNPKGNTGNWIVDFFHGREFNPQVMGLDMKLQTFRFSMIGLALLNVAMVVDDVVKHGGKVNPLVVMGSAFQVLYALDAMFFEEYFFFSHDAMNSGFGYSLASSYHTFPFLPTLITRYLISRG